MMTESEVRRKFDEGFDCSQIVLGHVCDRVGITYDEAMKLASGLGVGLFRGAECGASLGALVALGMRYGNSEPGDMTSKFNMYDKRDEFIKRFEEANGSLMCQKLLGVKVESTPQLLSTSSEGLYRNCPRYCVNAIRILEDML